MDEDSAPRQGETDTADLLRLSKIEAAQAGAEAEADPTLRRAVYDDAVRRREAKRDRLIAANLADADQRHAPDFLLIGTQRGGTTTLYHALMTHPEIGGSVRKESHFYDRHYERGQAWYHAHFPLRGEFKVVGEATPAYLRTAAVPARVQRDAPEVKLLALLRNPVDRAYSSYHMALAKGKEDRPFAVVVDQLVDGVAPPAEAGYVGDKDRYVEIGHYAEQLEGWFACFSRERFLIIRSEDFFADMRATLDQIFAFLGVAPWSPGVIEERHRTNNPPLPPDLRDRLAAYYRPLNERLYALLGRDFGWEALNAERSARDRARASADAAPEAELPA